MYRHIPERHPGTPPTLKIEAVSEVAALIAVLEEIGVKVDVVTGTSMGSMVGGAYAAGYSAAQIADIVTGVDWDKMMAPRADRDS